MAIRSQLSRSSARRSGSTLGSGAVDQIIPGTGIGVSPAGGTGNVTVSNTGVLSVAAGTGISVTGTAQNPIVNNTTGGTVTTIASADNGLAVANPSGPVVTLTQQTQAEWDSTVTRVYAVRNDGSGSDSNVGFATPASASLADFQAACVAAGAAAKATFAGLAAILPRSGSGRKVCILILSNAATPYVGGLDVFMGGLNGYADGSMVRATVTNSTASSVAFSGSDGDRTMVGGITATGMNAAGYNPTGAATTTSLPCTKVGGAAPGFTAGGLAIPIGWRIRFDAATTTAALRNKCYPVAEITTTTTLIPSLPFDASPVAGDVFYLEMAGVTCDTYFLNGLNTSGPPTQANLSLGFQIVGINSSGRVTCTGGFYSFTFCGGSQIVWGSVNVANATMGAQCGPFYVDQFTNPFTVGGGFRSEGLGIIAGGNYKNLLSLVVATSSLQVDGAFGFQLRDGCAVQRLIVEDAFLGTAIAGISTGPLPNIGVASAFVQGPIIRSAGSTTGAVVGGACVRFGLVNISGCGATPAISVRGVSILTFSGVVSGSTGNTDVGLDLVNSRNSIIILTATPTVTGTAGDVRLAGGQIITWAQALAGVIDSAGNRIYSTIGTCPTSMANFSFGTTADAAVAQTCYLCNQGVNLTFGLSPANLETTPFRYPTSQRLMARLRITCLFDTVTVPVVATLMKNNVATAMTISIPGSTAANTKFVDSAHPILFNDGDDFDIRVAVPANGVGLNLIVFSATLEWFS